MPETGPPPHGTYFDGRTAAGQSVWVTLDPGGMTISAGIETIARWPRATLQAMDGYAHDPAGATFRQRGGIERLHITDPALVAQLRREGLSARPAAGWSGRAWLGFGAAFAGAVVLVAILVDQLPALILPLVPHSVERGWSSAIEGAVSIGSRTCAAPRGNAALTTLMARLSAAAGVAPMPRFDVIDSPTINAFTLPDGRILILRGLITKAQDPDELAGVLAHELGHVRHRDPTREMLRRLELNMVGRYLGWGGNLAGQLTALSYGRRAEAAADASALQTLRAAHLRADGLSRFFTLLLGASHGDGIPAFLSTHPATADRAATLRSGVEGDTAMDEAAWRDVKDICKE